MIDRAVFVDECAGIEIETTVRFGGSMPNHFRAEAGEQMPFFTAVMSASGFACNGASETSSNFHRE
jgi:hypothetical protein